MRLEERLTKVLFDTDYRIEFTFKVFPKTTRLTTLSGIITKTHKKTEEKTSCLLFSNSYLDYSKNLEQDIIKAKLKLLERLCDDMLDDKFGGLEIKETHIDEN